MQKDEYVVENIDKDVPKIASVVVDKEWRNYPKTITVNATDEGTSGIAAYAITTSNRKEDIKASDWNAETKGTWTSKGYEMGTYYAWVKDGAGSISEPVQVKVEKIEREVPTIDVDQDSNPEKSQTATITIADNKKL